MRSLPLSDTSWTHPSYEIRVRDTKYLWGSAGIVANIKFDRSLNLHVRNDPFGEDIKIVVVADGVQTEIGTLGASECVTVPLQNLMGVFATCNSETTVHCLIN